MNNEITTDKLNLRHFPFCLGLGAVQLALWIPYLPDWLTFIHMWRVELFASLFLGCALLLIIARPVSSPLGFRPARLELFLLILPICSFIVWSFASALWAESWKSAIHHGLVWASYLIFYCIVRHSLERDGFYRKVMCSVVEALVLYALPAVSGYVSILAYGGSNTLGIRFARFGEQVIAITPLLIVGLVYLTGRYRAAALAAFGILCLLMVCTLGRTNIALFSVAAVGGMIVVMFTGPQKRRRRLVLPAAVLLISPFLIFAPTFFGNGPVAPVISRMSDRAAISNSDGFRKLMISLSLEMVAQSPVIGVGADNFGMRVNEFRESYARSNPGDPNLAQSENELPERAHNEYLQILAELGIVGAAIFVWFLSGIVFLAWRAVKGSKQLPPHALAAVFGLGLFLTSSLVSSYSFRLIQNGFVFFFVLAVAAKLVFKKTQSVEKPEFVLSGNRLSLAAACGLAACFLLASYSAIRVGSVIVGNRANFESDFASAQDSYLLAMRLDDENPFARNHYGMRLFHLGRYQEAVPLLTEAIELGVATSSDFSYLAAAKSFAGDNVGAEAVLQRASVFYPRSVFVLTRYATLLEENGKYAESARAFEKALEIDPRAARTWKALMTIGPHRVSEDIARGADYDAVMELRPLRATYSVVTERLIRHPEERQFSMLSVK